MAKIIDDERFCFIVDWYEEQAARIRQFQFFYFVKSQAIEMYDTKNRRMFLRTNVTEDNLRLSDLYLGNMITICGRSLKLVDFGDEYTRRTLSAMTERTVGFIKPEAYSKLGQILDMIIRKGFLLSQLRTCHLTRQAAAEFYREHIGKPYYIILQDFARVLGLCVGCEVSAGNQLRCCGVYGLPAPIHHPELLILRIASSLLDCLTKGPIAAFEIVGENAVNVWKAAMGPADPAEARIQAPTSLRAQFGQNKFLNAVHGADSSEAAAREIEFFFSRAGPRMPNTARVGNCTCCVIKPSAMKAGIAGNIIMDIVGAGFEVGAAQMFSLEKANAEEFLEVYKGVVHEYCDMVSELVSGPCLALEIKGPDDAPPIVPAFRALVGPSDPEIARHLRPRTLRAIYGVDKVRNAIHCTDLPEDGQLEVEYFFRILDR